MAITIESTSIITAGNRSMLTITKPLNTAEGDLLVAFVARNSSGDSNPWYGTPADWTNEENASSASYANGTFFYKIAGASEPSDYSWDPAAYGNSAPCGGIIYRISGFNSVTPISASNSATTASFSTPQAYANTITPTDASSLLIIGFVSAANSGNTGDALTINGYSIATDNPSWTEQTESNVSGTTISSATATRTETSATGDTTITATVPTSSQRTACLILSINPAGAAAVNSNFLAFM